MGRTALYKLGFYYEQLKIDQQVDYRKVAQAISKYESQVSVQTRDMRQLHQVLVAVKYDNPEFCYWSMDSSETDNGILKLDYLTETEEETMELVRKLRKKRSDILEELYEGKDEITQKEVLRAVYDYLSENITYAEDELQKPTCSSGIYDVRGVLLKGKGVCLGIALSVNYLCQALHIPAILITGEAKVAGWTGNHGWNLIKMDDEYYHLDVTSAIETELRNRDRYFLVKDKELGDRNWPEAIYPKAE